MKGLSPRQLYREEKEKARQRNVSHAQLMAEAKREFEAMLAAGQAARKSGRPKKVPTPPPEDELIVELPAAKLPAKAVTPKAGASKDVSAAAAEKSPAEPVAAPAERSAARKAAGKAPVGKTRRSANKTKAPRPPAKGGAPRKAAAKKKAGSGRAKAVTKRPAKRTAKAATRTRKSASARKR